MGFLTDLATHIATWVSAHFEPALGSPDADGKVLSSTAAGVRSWVTSSGGASLPDQTGHSGQVLTTDGSAADWTAVQSVANQRSGGNNIKFWTGTQAQYDAIATPDEDIIYYAE